MRSTKLDVLLSFCAASACSASHTRPTSATRSSQNQVTTQEISFDQGFWFTQLKVGDSQNASVLIDTGSSKVVLNQGLYKASSSAGPLHQQFSIGYGTTDITGSGSELINGTLFQDVVHFGGIQVGDQAFGSVTGSSSGSGYPHDGILGLASQMFSANNQTTFFHNLCTEEIIAECRFGLGLNRNGSGSVTIGALNSGVSEGDLTVSPIKEEWFLLAGITMAGVSVSDALVELDSGTAGVTGPIETVKEIFDHLSIVPNEQDTPDGKVVTGTVPCDGPPGGMLMLSLPSQSDQANRSTDSTVDSQQGQFGIASRDLVGPKDTASSNCTYGLVGLDVKEQPGLWVFGQNFFQGKYIDFNLEDRTIGIVDLDRTHPTSGLSNQTSSGTSNTTASSGVPSASSSLNSLAMSSLPRESSSLGLLVAVAVTAAVFAGL